MSGRPNSLVFIALALYVPVALVCFRQFGARRGMLVATFGGWLFLPPFDQIDDAVPLLHTKAAFVPAIVLLSSLVCDLPRWRGFKVRWFDVPAAVLVCAFPAAALANGNGLYDAASTALQASMTWGATYLLGRLYFSTPATLRDLATAMVTAASAYVPFCLWELRMSPQLNRTIYGYHQHQFIQTIRYGGYRPMVFMQHGLMVALFMACGALVAYWLWRTRAVPRVIGFPTGLVAAALMMTTVLCKSAGAIILLAVGIAVLEAVRASRVGAFVVLLALVPPVFSGSRVAGWSGEALIDRARAWIDAERAVSLEARIGNENLLVAKAMQHPWIGWSAAEFQLFNDEGEETSVSDSLWIIALGATGLTGLAAVWTVLLAPVVWVLRRVPARRWADGRTAALAALGTALVLSAVDSLFNFMMMPFFPMISGALVSIRLAPRRSTLRLAPGRARGPAERHGRDGAPPPKCHPWRGAPSAARSDA